MSKRGAATGKRRLPDWLSGFDTFTQNSESPRSFHLWAGISAISAALQRRCYMKWGHDTIYPNMYIVLVGPSGRVRKGDPINISQSFIKPLPIPILLEQNSPEYVARFMKENLQSFTDPITGNIMMHSSVCCFLEELAVFTGEKNTGFLSTLTNWYDSRNNWGRGTKNAGIDDIVGVCLNMLAATAPDWIPFIFTREAIGGGFTSRCIFVVEDHKAQIVANPNKVAPNSALREALQEDIAIISTMAGQFEFEPQAEDEYEQWYVEQERRLQEALDNQSIDPVMQGYFARRPTHIKKVGMALSASKRSDYIISVSDFRRARTILEIAEKRMPSVFQGTGSARYVHETEIVLGIIRQAKEIKRSDLLRLVYRNVDENALQTITRTLSEMHIISVRLSGPEAFYTYKD